MAASSLPTHTYRVTEHGQVACAWYYTVEAPSAAAAIAEVESGNCDPWDSDTSEPVGDSTYEAEINEVATDLVGQLRIAARHLADATGMDPTQKDDRAAWEAVGAAIARIEAFTRIGQPND